MVVMMWMHMVVMVVGRMIRLRAFVSLQIWCMSSVAVLVIVS